MMGCGLLLTRFLLLIRIDRWLSGGYNRIELRRIRDLAEFPDSKKEKLKPYFVAEGLVPDKKRVLLGSSRTDIAALVLKVVLGKLLCKGGSAVSTAPYKVIWEAYGKSHFHPVILNSEDGQVWQANQAMHAFIPCWNEADAKRIRSALQHPTIPALLKQLNGNGKCNWA